MKSFKRPNPYRGITKGEVIPGDRELSGKEYRGVRLSERIGCGVTIVRVWPKVRGKCAVKRQKRQRMTDAGLLAA